MLIGYEPLSLLQHSRKQRLWGQIRRGYVDMVLWKTPHGSSTLTIRAQTHEPAE